MLDTLILTSFETLVGSEFVLTRPDGGNVTLLLSEAAAVATAPEGHRQPFSLLFESTDTVDLSQGIYHLHNQQIGSLDLFLVPVQPGTRGSRFEAVFT